MGRVEVFSFDVNTGQGQTLPGGFFALIVAGADLAQSFAHAFRFICPSELIPGKQAGAAF